MALIKIGGFEMPQPIKYSIPMDDIESADSAYSESGIKIRNRIRQGIATLDLAWRVDTENAKIILDAIEPIKVLVEYLDPRTGGIKISEMYAESRSCDLISFKGESIESENLWDISFSLLSY